MRRFGLFLAAVVTGAAALTGCAPLHGLDVLSTGGTTPSASTAPTAQRTPPGTRTPPAVGPGIASCDARQVRPFTCDSFTIQYPGGNPSSFEAWFDVLDGKPRFVVGESERLLVLPVRLTGSGASAAPVAGWAPLQRGCTPDSECALDQVVERIFTSGARITIAGPDIRLEAGDVSLVAEGTGRQHRYPQLGRDVVAGHVLLTYRDNGTHNDAFDGGPLAVNAAGCLASGSSVLVLPDTTGLHPDGSIDIAGRHVRIGQRLSLGGGQGRVPADQRCGTGAYFYGVGT